MSKNLIPAQRRKRIQEYLGLHKIAHIADLTNLLDVSEATVRRDLERLENEGILERTHGGAILSQRIQLEPEYLQRAQRHPKEKRLIGLVAASMIKDGDIIFINSGTTSTQVIRHIPNNPNIKVITNNLSAALEVGESGFDLILLGGYFQPKSNSVAGSFAVENLSQIYASKTFLGVDGISLKYGCTVPTEAEANMIRLMIQRTRGPISIIADSSKWGIVSNYQIANIDQIHKWITDDALNDQAYEELLNRSVDVVIANNVFDRA